jgi:hypothetical protein
LPERTPLSRASAAPQYLTSTKIHRRSIDSQGFVGELRRVIASAIQVGFRVPAGQHGIQIPQSSSRVAPSAPEGNHKIWKISAAVPRSLQLHRMAAVFVFHLIGRHASREPTSEEPRGFCFSAGKFRSNQSRGIPCLSIGTRWRKRQLLSRRSENGVSIEVIAEVIGKKPASVEEFLKKIGRSGRQRRWRVRKRASRTWQSDSRTA